MRSIAAIVGLLAALGLSQQRLQAEPLDQPSVTIQVHDYATVPPNELARAQEAVTQLYRAIDVGATWLRTCRFSELTPDSRLPTRADDADFTLIVLSPHMVSKLAPRPGVVGLAPGTTTVRGRLAYVFYDRLQRLALSPAEREIDWLGVVMAHEIGHLLLPYGSHSETGVMREAWNMTEIKSLDLRHLAFTPAQARQIRRRVLASWFGSR